MRRISQRATSVNPTVIPTRISASTCGEGVPVMYGWPANTSWRMASSPTANGMVAIARAPSAPSLPTGKLSPDTKYTGSIITLVRWKASRPHRRYRLAIAMPRPYSADSVRKNTAISRPHCWTLNVTPNTNVDDDEDREPRGSSS